MTRLQDPWFVRPVSLARAKLLTRRIDKSEARAGGRQPRPSFRHAQRAARRRWQPSPARHGLSAFRTKPRPFASSTHTASSAWLIRSS